MLSRLLKIGSLPEGGRSRVLLQKQATSLETARAGPGLLKIQHQWWIKNRTAG